jgi:hypothetical protein
MYAYIYDREMLKIGPNNDNSNNYIRPIKYLYFFVGVSYNSTKVSALRSGVMFSLTAMSV